MIIPLTREIDGHEVEIAVKVTPMRYRAATPIDPEEGGTITIDHATTDGGENEVTLTADEIETVKLDAAEKWRDQYEHDRDMRQERRLNRPL